MGTHSTMDDGELPSAPSSSCRTILVTELAPTAMRKRETWRIDEFHLQKKIGSGYASMVYLATCMLTGNQVAIKLYHKNKLTDLNVFQIYREIHIHSMLCHKHIIQLWAAFEDDHAIYLVSEYASQGDVFAYVERRGGNMSEVETVQQVLHPFLQALSYLHERKIMHRDIKPENLLFTASGVLKVADFGLSIKFDEEHPVTRVGTLDYMAPEVVVCPDKQFAEENKDVKHLRYTPQVDSWAVGVLAYELCVGQPPFDRGHKKLTIAEILNGDPELPSFLSEEAGSFIRWALTKNRHMRPTVQRLIAHPWIICHMQKPQRVRQATRAFGKHMRAYESFVDPRSKGLKTEVEQQSALPGLEDTVHGLQVKAVQQGGRMLGHSHSLNATDMMRWRDIAFNAGAFGPKLQALVDAAAPKRKSICGGYDTSEPGSRRSSFAMTAGMLGKGSPVAAALAAAAAYAEQSPTANRLSGGMRRPGLLDLAQEQPMTRQEIFASLQASARQFNRSPTFTPSLPTSPSKPRSNPEVAEETDTPPKSSQGPPEDRHSITFSPSLSSRPSPAYPAQSPRAVRTQLKSHVSTTITTSPLPPRAPPAPPASGGYRGVELRRPVQPRLSSGLPSIHAPEQDDVNLARLLQAHRSVPVTVMRSVTEPATLAFTFRPQPPSSPPPNPSFSFLPSRSSTNSSTTGFMPALSPSKDSGSGMSAVRLHRMPRSAPTSTNQLPQQQLRPLDMPKNADGLEALSLATKSDILCSRESSFVLKRPSQAPVAAHAVTGLVHAPRVEAAERQVEQAARGSQSKRADGGNESSSVPHLLQSAKEILGGLRKVFA